MPDAALGADALELAGPYRLLAELLSAEPDAELLALAATVPALRPHATQAAAARHTHVFVLNVYPFASVFLDPDGALDGERTALTRGVLGALGLRVAPGLAADHVSVLLDALATLLEREAAARSALDRDRARHAQRVVLLEHLLPWMPLFLAAIERADGALYGAAARLAGGLLSDHVGRLPASSHGSVPTWNAAPRGPAEPPRTERGRRDRLGWLTVPARSGVFLSRSDLAGIAGDLDLALRFGGRGFMVESLVQAASQADRTSELTDALARRVTAQRDEVAAWGRRLPQARPLWAPWLELSAATLARLGRSGTAHPVEVASASPGRGHVTGPPSGGA